MSFASDAPAWSALRSRLALLAVAAGASEAYILDAWGNVWCATGVTEPARQLTVIELARKTAATARPPLPQGGRLDRVVADGEGHGYARSFASVYLLLLTSVAPIDVVTARRAIGSALAEIEALTLALPPRAA